MKRKMLTMLVFCSVFLGGTYASAQSHGYTFDIDETQSQLTLEVSVSALGGFVTDSDSDSTFVDGAIDATLSPESGLFSTIHITDIHMQALDNIVLSFLSNNVTCTAKDIELRSPLDDATVGPATVVDALGGFNQTGNTVKLLGTVDVVGSVLGEDIDEHVNLGEEPATPLDFTGTITDNGTLVTLAMLDIDSETVITEDLPDGLDYIKVKITGDIYATAQTVPEPLTMSLLGVGAIGLLRRRKR